MLSFKTHNFLVPWLDGPCEILEGMRLTKGRKSNSSFLQISIIANRLLGRNKPFFQLSMLIYSHAFWAVIRKQDQYRRPLVGQGLKKDRNNLPKRMLLYFSLRSCE